MKFELSYFSIKKNILPSNIETNFSKLNSYISTMLKKNDELFYEVTFVTNSYIKKLNLKYRHLDKPTDVLSFCISNSPLLGNIFISYQYAKKEALFHKWTLNYEICLLFIHGILHLLGYDHDTKEKEKHMFKMQELILKENEIFKTND
ncbi:MAG: rRNA maturation RNase YbeY [Mycoplasmataceae bacterium]|nr:rRNA maturation RNase YbeY [Mycoplasmataceae bacterium]